jgi:hypothetical protein
MILCCKDGTKKLVNPIQLLVFTLAHDEDASCPKYHKGHFRNFQFVFTLYPRIATGVVTTFDVVFFFQKGIELFTIDVIITGEIRVDENDFLFLD